MPSSVKDPVTMWAQRKIGKNVPALNTSSYFKDEIEVRLLPNYEIVKIVITPDG